MIGKQVKNAAAPHPTHGTRAGPADTEGRLERRPRLRLPTITFTLTISLATSTLVLPPTEAEAQTSIPTEFASKGASHIVAMVLPKEEQNIEKGFRDYLVKRHLPVRFESVPFSGDQADGAELVRKLRALKPDLIYTWGTGTTIAVAGRYDAADPIDSIRNIPIVFTEVTDPVAAGLLRQLDPPRRNVTGVSHVAPLTVQLNTMLSFRPFKRIGYIINPAESNTRTVAQGLQSLTDEMGFELLQETVPLDEEGRPDPSALPQLIGRLAERNAELLYIGPSTFLAFTHRDIVTRAALEARLPTFCSTESIVRRSQCMFGLFANGSNVGRFAAYKASQILVDHTPVENIAAQTLQRFSLLINMPVVRELEFYPPLTLLNMAEVIE